MTHLALLILPRAMFPEAFHHVKLSLLVLRVSVFRSQLARHFSIEGVTSLPHHDS